MGINSAHNPAATIGRAAEHQRSIEQPNAFWLEQADLVDWITPPAVALDDSGAPLYRWYPDATLNTCYNALDRHVAAGRGDTLAFIYDSAMTGTKRYYSYNLLLERVNKFAHVLRRHGVTKGDRVLLYLPMIPAAVIATLACARIGAIHSIVFGGFAANELAIRIEDAKPKLVITASGGFEPGKNVEYLPILASALEQAEADVEAVIVRKREDLVGAASHYQDDPHRQWLDWDTEMSTALADVDPVPVASTDPLYILYTSGTTGVPKGVVRDNGGHAVALAYTMKNLYDVGPGDVMWTASDIGWVVGHSYIIYGPLIAGATTILYEGKPVGTPDAGAFWRVVKDHAVNVLFTAPTALRAIRRVDPLLKLLRGHDISSLRALFLAGERLDTETFGWAKEALDVPVIDHWWQTETGWAIAGNMLGLEPLPIKPGSPSQPMPGYDVHVVSSKGKDREIGADGNIVIKLPLPPGTLPTLWQGDEKFRSSYLEDFPGYYNTGDSGYFDEDGYLYVMGRTDDIINVAGHRLSTGSIEEAIIRHPLVAEVAVVGVKDALKGQRAAGFVTLKHGLDKEDPDALAAEIVRLVRDTVGPVAAFKDVTILQRLPKTRSGKILRRTIRHIVDGEPYRVPATIEEPGTLDALKAAIGYRASVE